MSISGTQQGALIRPIAEAAGAISFIERSRIYRSGAEIRLNDALLQHAAGPSFKAVGITTTVRNYTIIDVVLDAATGLLFQDQIVIPETSYFPGEQAGRDSTLHRNELVRLDVMEDIIIGFNNAHWGYQHWLTQCIPAIDWALRQQRTRDVRLALPPLAPWQENILDVLGYSQIQRITLKPNTFYHFPHVEYSAFLNGATSFGVCLSARDTALRILDRLPSTKPPYPILFVPCSNPYYGAIRNEDEVTDVLRRRGVHVVDPSLGTGERINLFRHADVVIGPLGQGLSDILFCKPGALLWEWMPEHHQNASFNRLAQAAGVDYWGDLFKSDPIAEAPGRWLVDVDTVTHRLFEISQRLALRAAGTNGTASRHPGNHAVGKPIEELMLAFESLGDNCEFGLVQRHAGVEPLGLLRFAGMSLRKLVVALELKFDGLGSIDTVTICPAGEPGRRELMVHETFLDTRYHTFILEGEIDASELREREAKRLGFLRRKMLEDLAVGEKIWVWRELGMTDPTRLQPLLNVLRILGPNILLWVVGADDDHQSGTVERLDHDFIKGYVERLAPYENATDIRPISWFEVCQQAHDLIFPDQEQPVLTEQLVVPPTGPLSAMEFLTRNQAVAQPVAPERVAESAPRFRRIWNRLGFR
jgi:hypothetical protein